MPFGYICGNKTDAWYAFCEISEWFSCSCRAKYWCIEMGFILICWVLYDFLVVMHALSVSKVHKIWLTACESAHLCVSTSAIAKRLLFLLSYCCKSEWITIQINNSLIVIMFFIANLHYVCHEVFMVHPHWDVYQCEMEVETLPLSCVQQLCRLPRERLWHVFFAQKETRCCRYSVARLQ